MNEHPLRELDDVVHQKVRLSLLVVLVETARAEFGFLRDMLELTDGNLSNHLRVLEEAGLIEVEKGYEGRRPRTWVKITKAGRFALDAELNALKAVVSRLESARNGEIRRSEP
jgi:DNA-binding MarR family transcriptional regulator